MGAYLVVGAGGLGAGVRGAALTAFGKAPAEEFGPQVVRVNTVSPGPLATPLRLSPTGYGAALAASYGMEQQAFLEILPGSMGMTTGRLIEPREVASLVAYLASPRAASVSGAEYVIDGGAVKALDLSRYIVLIREHRGPPGGLTPGGNADREGEHGRFADGTADPGGRRGPGGRGVGAPRRSRRTGGPAADLGSGTRGADAALAAVP